MSKMSYGASLLIVVRSTVDGKPAKAEELRFPVRSFQVAGGAHRKIDLASTNEGSIGSEFEQARIYKNVILDLGSGAGTPPTELVNLSKSVKRDFSMSFTVSVYDDGGKPVRRYDLQSFATNFAEIPAPVGNTPPSLRARLILSSPRVLHGRRDEQRGIDLLEEV